MEAWTAAKNALECVLEAKKGESLIIFCDDEKISVGKAFEKGALTLGLQTRLLELKTETEKFRTDIPSDIMEFLTTRKPDIYVNLMRGIREETPFRIKLMQMENKESRMGHCPGVTPDMLTEGALALSTEEHKQMQAFAEKLMNKLSQAVKLHVKNPSGTDVTLSVKDRPFFTDTKIDWETRKWMNLPTGEVLAAPVENSLEGKLVCDMAIGGIGLLKTPVDIAAKMGKVCDTFSADMSVLRKVKDSLNTDERSNVIGEFAFGINSKARFVEEFLESEKMLGTIHMAFGNNSDMPSGQNKSRNHMDFMFSNPTVKVFNRDGNSFTVLADGVFKNP